MHRLSPATCLGAARKETSPPSPEGGAKARRKEPEIVEAKTDKPTPETLWQQLGTRLHGSFCLVLRRLTAGAVLGGHCSVGMFWGLELGFNGFRAEG